MRIAILTGHYPQWSERFVQREAEALAACGHTVWVWPCEAPLSEARWREPEGRPLPPLESSRGSTWQALQALAGCGLWQVRRLAGVLRAAVLLPDRPHVVLAQFAGLPAVVGHGLAHSLSLPLVVAAHARDVWVPWPPGWRAATQARAVVCCNQTTADELAARLPAVASKLRCIHHGLPKRTMPDVDRTPPAAPLILACGRFVEKKGFGVLLAALPEILAEVQEAKVRLIGDGPGLLALGRQRQALGAAASQVEILTRQTPEGLATHMASAAVLAVPSVIGRDNDRDGIPNVILEAWQQSVPVVASAVGGIPEVVRDGQTGWLVPAGDPAALAAALIEALTQPEEAQRRARQGQEIVRQSFDLAANVAQLEALLSTVASPA